MIKIAQRYRLAMRYNGNRTQFSDLDIFNMTGEIFNRMGMRSCTSKVTQPEVHLTAWWMYHIDLMLVSHVQRHFRRRVLSKGDYYGIEADVYKHITRWNPDATYQEFMEEAITRLVDLPDLPLTFPEFGDRLSAIDLTTKTCSTCGFDKTVEEFFKGNDGRRRSCKSCDQIRRLKHA